MCELLTKGRITAGVDDGALGNLAHMPRASERQACGQGRYDPGGSLKERKHVNVPKFHSSVLIPDDFVWFLNYETDSLQYAPHHQAHASAHMQPRARSARSSAPRTSYQAPATTSKQSMHVAETLHESFLLCLQCPPSIVLPPKVCHESVQFMLVFQRLHAPQMSGTASWS